MSNLVEALNNVAILKAAQIPEPEELDYDYEFSELFSESIKHISKESNYTYVSVGTHRIRTIVAVALIAICMLIMVGCVVVGELIINWQEEKHEETDTTSISFDIDNLDDNNITNKFTYPSAPEGYVIVEEYKGKVALHIRYQSATGEIIEFIQMKDAENVSVEINNENTVVLEINIGKYKASLLNDNDMKYLMWTDGYWLYRISGTVDESLLIEMGEEIAK